MALIHCPECGKEISDKTKTCLYCGYPFDSLGPAQATNLTTYTESTLDRLFARGHELDYAFLGPVDDDVKGDYSIAAQSSTSSAPTAATRCQSYVVLDFETTGLSPVDDAVIEVGMLKIVDNVEVATFSSFVNPERPISERITNITGVRDADVRDAPTVAEISQVIRQFIGDLPLVAHNASFDVGFLKEMYKEAGIEATIVSIDTLALARKAFPQAPNHKLNTLVELLSLGASQEHRALSDVRLTHALLLKCLERGYFSCKTVSTTSASAPASNSPAPNPTVTIQPPAEANHRTAPSHTGSTIFFILGGASLLLLLTGSILKIILGTILATFLLGLGAAIRFTEV